MTKDNEPVRLYVGSGTRDAGYQARWKVYTGQHKATLPSRVKVALDDGFKMTHMGLLAMTPLPAFEERAPVRSLFLAIEALFSAMFFAQDPGAQDQLCADLLPWSRMDVTWDSLCSHSLLREWHRVGSETEEERNARRGKNHDRLHP